MTFAEWMQKHPYAATDLLGLLGALPFPEIPTGGDGKSEAWAQQQVRFKVAVQGGMTWRNNKGATPAKCPECGAKQTPIRYGLANDSQRLSDAIKSHDLVLAIPRLITPKDVGTTIAQFGSVECKRPGWKFTGTEEEVGQAAWGALIHRIGGFATFSTGDLKL